MHVHSFGNLYGPPKSSGDDENWYGPDTTRTSKSGAECAAYSKCKALGLTGDCCPHLGVMLGCCD